MRLTYIFLLFIIFSPGILCAQLSNGGFPLKIHHLKSVDEQLVSMPLFKQSVIDEAMMENSSEENLLKPFRFAHTFEVNLNAANSGKWYTTSANYNVWQLKLRSTNAKSINLIFEKFALPKGARLFIYSEKHDHYLGAFTFMNNQSSGKFAVAPVVGDEIVVQYEVPEKSGTPVDFQISRVNHDFVGVVKSERRPYYGQEAGECNIDVNCEIGDPWNQVKNSVCRIIVNGVEICSGTLLNNTAEDEKPYVLSAAHCYDSWDLAETSVYTFNYESPYCEPIDGDPIHSLSGAEMKAQFDSLDFALVELNELPPPHYRPFYAGWDKSASVPDSSVSIHHPKGDIKKIAFENDPIEISDFTKTKPQNGYTRQGFWRVPEWDGGVTEIGSSGGALFSNQELLIGTLTGGGAICGNTINDYFSRFDMQWDYKSDSTKQLKCWLDPIESGNQTLQGKQFNVDEDYCQAFTNLSDIDQHKTIGLTVSGESQGYWGGTNSIGITEFVERFSVPGQETLDGISFGIGKLVLHTSRKNEITVNVYNGSSLPESLIHSQIVDVSGFSEDAMNYIGFDARVEPDETFFVGFELSEANAPDTFVIYQSLHQSGTAENTFYFNQTGTWYDFKEANPQKQSMINVMELVACNVDLITDTPRVEVPVNVLVFPNPTSDAVVIESDQRIRADEVSVYNMIGQGVGVRLANEDPYRVRLDFRGNSHGVYFIRFPYDGQFVTRKVSFVSW